MDALTVDVIRYGLTAGGLAWVGYWEHREQRIQAVLKTIRIKFRATEGRDAPGYFIWTSVQPPRTTATQAHQAWWESLDEDDQDRIEHLNDITTGSAA
jgi:hypothetical protein